MNLSWIEEKYEKIADEGKSECGIFVKSRLIEGVNEDQGGMGFNLFW